MDVKVVHCKKEPYDIYIGRPSIWGNPFKIYKHGRTREEVLEKYREYLLSNSYLLERIKELDGKVLGCWCSPLPCHGDVIVEVLNKIKKEERKMEEQKVVMYVVNQQKFIGKMELPKNGAIYLKDVIQCMEVMTPTGMVIMGTILADEMRFSEDKCEFIYFELNKKSPYYGNYFQTWSNLSIASSVPQGRNKIQ